MNCVFITCPVVTVPCMLRPFPSVWPTECGTGSPWVLAARRSSFWLTVIPFTGVYWGLGHLTLILPCHSFNSGSANVTPSTFYSKYVFNYLQRLSIITYFIYTYIYMLSLQLLSFHKVYPHFRSLSDLSLYINPSTKYHN